VYLNFKCMYNWLQNVFQKSVLKMFSTTCRVYILILKPCFRFLRPSTGEYYNGLNIFSIYFNLFYTIGQKSMVLRSIFFLLWRPPIVQSDSLKKNQQKERHIRNIIMYHYNIQYGLETTRWRQNKTRTTARGGAQKLLLVNIEL